MTTKSQMEYEREHYRKLLMAWHKYKEGEDFSTNDAAHWIGRKVGNAFHLLSVMEKDGYVSRINHRSSQNGGLRWRKVGSKLMRVPLRKRTDSQLGIEPVRLGLFVGETQCTG